MRGCTLVRGNAGAGIDIIVVVADKGTKTPLDVSVVEADVLPFAFVVLAVHQFHICARGVQVEVLEAVNAIIAVSPERTFSGSAWGVFVVKIAQVQISFWIGPGDA